MGKNKQAGELGFRIARPSFDRDWDEAPPRVTEIRAGGPADGTGLRVGDFIVAVDGHDVRDKNHQLVYPLLQVPPGTAVRLELSRGETMTLTAGRPRPGW